MFIMQMNKWKAGENRFEQVAHRPGPRPGPPAADLRVRSVVSTHNMSRWKGMKDDY